MESDFKQGTVSVQSTQSLSGACFSRTCFNLKLVNLTSFSRGWTNLYDEIWNQAGFSVVFQFLPLKMEFKSVQADFYPTSRFLRLFLNTTLFGHDVDGLELFQLLLNLKIYGPSRFTDFIPARDRENTHSV